MLYRGIFSVMEEACDVRPQASKDKLILLEQAQNVDKADLIRPRNITVRRREEEDHLDKPKINGIESCLMR